MNNDQFNQIKTFLFHMQKKIDLLLEERNLVYVPPPPKNKKPLPPPPSSNEPESGYMTKGG